MFCCAPQKGSRVLIWAGSGSDTAEPNTESVRRKFSAGTKDTKLNWNEPNAQEQRAASITHLQVAVADGPRRRVQVSAHAPSVPVQAVGVGVGAALRARRRLEQQAAGAGGVLARTRAGPRPQGPPPAGEGGPQLPQLVTRRRQIRSCVVVIDRAEQMFVG